MYLVHIRGLLEKAGKSYLQNAPFISRILPFITVWFNRAERTVLQEDVMAGTL